MANRCLSLPASARALLRADETDSVYFRVITLDGKLAGRRQGLARHRRRLPVMTVVPGEIYLRDADFKGQDLRLAYTYLS